MNDMDLDRAAASSGLTREELLKRAAVGGAVIVAGGSLVRSAQGAPAGLAASTPKRGDTFRIGVTGGSAKDFIDGKNIVTLPAQARIVAG